jgi:hypothetical protein
MVRESIIVVSSFSSKFLNDTKPGANLASFVYESVVT